MFTWDGILLSESPIIRHTSVLLPSEGEKRVTNQIVDPKHTVNQINYFKTLMNPESMVSNYSNGPDDDCLLSAKPQVKPMLKDRHNHFCDNPKFAVC